MQHFSLKLTVTCHDLTRFTLLFFYCILIETNKFSSKIGADDDDTILKAFDAFEVNGKIDADM